MRQYASCGIKLAFLYLDFLMTSLSKTKFAVFFTLVLILSSNNTLAATPLTESLIEQWLLSQNAFAIWGKENEEKLNLAEEQPNEHKNPLDMTAASLIEPLNASGLYASANQLVKQYQFNNLEQWADITIRITTAAAAIELEKNPKATDTSELEALQASSQLSPEQKTLIAQAILQNKAMVKQLIERATVTDKKAIEPFLSRIHNLMDTP